MKYIVLLTRAYLTCEQTDFDLIKKQIKLKSFAFIFGQCNKTNQRNKYIHISIDIKNADLFFIVPKGKCV